MDGKPQRKVYVGCLSLFCKAPNLQVDIPESVQRQTYGYLLSSTAQPLLLDCLFLILLRVGG